MEIVTLSTELWLTLLILTVPTFFFWQWLLKKFITNKRNRILATWSATLVLTPAILIIAIWFVLYMMFGTTEKDFSKEAWRNKKSERFQMASDIIESKMLIGKDTGEVKQLLGDPNPIHNLFGGSSEFNWIYDMGQGGGGLGFMFHHLRLHMDSSRHVVSVDYLRIND